MEGLRALYAAWCHAVPFDNVRKLIHVRNADPAPLPGSTPRDFFESWLRWGAGGTCWVVAGALHCLLESLGFPAQRGIATMLVVPHLPPNHGTVIVTFDGVRYLLDGGMLHGEPLRLDEMRETSIDHPAWGVRCAFDEGRWTVRWRPLHLHHGLDCRLETIGATAEQYFERYQNTRGWSPFNYELSVRLNQGGNVNGTAFGQWVTFGNDGSIASEPVSHQDRLRRLVEEIGLSEEIVARIPVDVPTPPPPGTKTAAEALNG